MKYILTILLIAFQFSSDAQYSYHRIDNYGENYKDTVLVKNGTDSLFRFFEGNYVFAGMIKRKVFVSANEVGNLSGILSVYQPNLVSGTNIKTINNQSLLGSGNIDVAAVGGASWGNISGLLSNQEDLLAALNSKQNALGFIPYNSTNPNGYISAISAADVTTALGFTPLSTNGSAANLTNFPILNQNTTGTSGGLSADIPQSRVTNLVNDLLGKAASSHSHAIGDVTNLQNTINLKANIASPQFTGAMSSTGSIGYAGAATGGAVTQTTNKTNPVTLNKICGQITMNNAALAAGAEVAFQVNNNLVAATDVIIVNVQGVGTAAAYLVGVGSVGNGNFSITVSNASAGSLSQAIVLNFFVLKAVNN